jgi:hypothetical protein
VDYKEDPEWREWHKDALRRVLNQNQAEKPRPKMIVNMEMAASVKTKKKNADVDLTTLASESDSTLPMSVGTNVGGISILTAEEHIYILQKRLKELQENKEVCPPTATTVAVSGTATIVEQEGNRVAKLEQVLVSSYGR